MKNFKCPRCNNSISIKELFRFKRKNQTKCDNCNTILKPIKIKSWNWGFVIGLLSVAIPAKIILFYYNDFLLAAFVGLLGGILGIFFVALHTYLSAEFEEI